MSLPPAASSETVCVNPEQNPSSAAQLRTLRRHPETRRRYLQLILLLLEKEEILMAYTTARTAYKHKTKQCNAAE